MKLIINIPVCRLGVFILLTTLTFSLSAQWYGRISYPRTSTFSFADRLYSHQLTPNPWGYVHCGYWPTSTTNNPNFDLSLVDENGFYTGFAIYNDYIIKDNPSCGTAAQILNCNGVAVTEAFNTGAQEVFAIAGVYDQAVFFSTLDWTGSPVRSYRWFLPASAGGAVPKKPFITRSSTNGQFFICSEYDNHSYVISVDASTSPLTVNWARTYHSHDSLLVRAVIESPYNSGEIVVVGKWTGRINIDLTSSEAFFLKLDAVNGNTLTFNTYGNGFLGNRWFTSIQPAASTGGGSNGYIIGGYSDSTLTLNTIDYPQWMTKLTPNGNTVWSTLIEPIYAGSHNTQTTWEINDVFERYNTNTSAYEYYGIGGSSINGYDYLSVFKLADDGTPGTLSPTEFRYFNAGGYQYYASCYITDIQSGTGGSTDGLQAFAEDFTTNDLVFAKAYFNGVAGCLDSISDIGDYHGGPDLNLTPTITVQNLTSSCPSVFELTVNSVTSNTVIDCQAVSLSDGSNGRVTGIRNVAEANNLSIWPSPTKQIVAITGDNLISAQVFLENGAGQVIHQVSPNKFSSGEMTIDFSALGLSSGMYIIKVVYSTGESTALKVIYQSN